MSDWGKGAINNNVYWGQAANNNIGWGNVQLTSWSGDTNISGIEEESILQVLPELYLEDINEYLYFRLKPEITPSLMYYILNWDNNFYADGTLMQDGVNWVMEYPESGNYQIELSIIVDGVTYRFTSNILVI